jgi:hypothetical protein
MMGKRTLNGRPYATASEKAARSKKLFDFTFFGDADYEAEKGEAIYLGEEFGIDTPIQDENNEGEDEV